MNNKEIKELLDTMDIITDEMYETQVNWEQLYIPELTLQFGNCIIEFLGVVIYNSEYDDRQWIENNDPLADLSETGYYEPWEPFLKKKINEAVEQVSKIKL